MWRITDKQSQEAVELTWFDRQAIARFFPNVSFQEMIPTTYTYDDGVYELYWVDDPVPQTVPETAEQAKVRGEMTVARKINDVARSCGFDSIDTAASRASFPESPWYGIGRALGIWRDQCWVASGEFSAQVAVELNLGTRTTFPTDEEILNALPAFIEPA